MRYQEHKLFAQSRTMNRSHILITSLTVSSILPPYLLCLWLFERIVLKEMWPRMLSLDHSNRIVTLGSYMMCQGTWMSRWKPCPLAATQGILLLSMADLFMSIASTAYMAASSIPGLIEPPSSSRTTVFNLQPCSVLVWVTQRSVRLMDGGGFAARVQVKRHIDCQAFILRRSSNWSQNNVLGTALIGFREWISYSSEDGAWGEKGNLNSKMDFWEVGKILWNISPKSSETIKKVPRQNPRVH